MYVILMSYVIQSAFLREGSPDCGTVFNISIAISLFIAIILIFKSSHIQEILRAKNALWMTYIG